MPPPSSEPGSPPVTGGEGAAGAGRRSRSGGVAPDAAFDLWLQRGLHAIYDATAQEPIPEELLRLIRKDRDK